MNEPTPCPFPTAAARRAPSSACCRPPRRAPAPARGHALRRARRRQARAPDPGLRRGASGRRAPGGRHRGGGAGADPRLLADPRRPAGHGRRRPAPRVAPPATRPSTRPPPSSPATPCRPWPSTCWRRTRQFGGDAAMRIAHDRRTWPRARGSLGMVGGQALDLASEGKELDLVMLENIHIHKTGALIRASVNMAALACPTSRRARRGAGPLRQVHRAGLPDPGRPARRGGRHRRHRQAERRRRSPRQGHLPVADGHRTRRTRPPRTWSTMR
jgi:hypothetical protein